MSWLLQIMPQWTWGCRYLFEIVILFSLGKYRSGIARCSIFNILRNLHTVFHGGCTNLHPYPLCTGVFFSPHSHQHLFIFCLFGDSHSNRWYLIMILICISVIISVEHLFMYFLGTCISSLEKCLFKSFAHFLIVLFILLLGCRGSLHIKPLSGTWFANIFSPFLPFHCWFSCCTEIFKFDVVPLVYFCFIFACAFGVTLLLLLGPDFHQDSLVVIFAFLSTSVLSSTLSCF